jgi:hypothetical protein
MSSTSAPFGLRPSRMSSGYGTRGEEALPGGIPTGYNTAIYMNQPIKFNSSGEIVPAAAGDSFVGVFVGVEYTDANGRRQISNQWVANTTATDVVVYFTSDPDMEYEIQAAGSLAQAAIGDQADFSNATANGSGFSQATLSTTLAGAGNSAQLRIVGLALYPDNAWGDTYTIVRVRINEHQFQATVNAI